MRIGHGFDVHQLIDKEFYQNLYPERGEPKLVLAGIEIIHYKFLKGHSDADVVIHALCDALLGAIAAGDIGQHFPDNDRQYSGIASSKLLDRVDKLVKQKGYHIINLDITILAEKPKLSPHIGSMRLKLAGILNINPEQISIKATTTEKLGFIGREEGIAAEAVVLVDS